MRVRTVAVQNPFNLPNVLYIFNGILSVRACAFICVYGCLFEIARICVCLGMFVSYSVRFSAGIVKVIIAVSMFFFFHMRQTTCDVLDHAICMCLCV